MTKVFFYSPYCFFLIMSRVSLSDSTCVPSPLTLLSSSRLKQPASCQEGRAASPPTQPTSATCFLPVSCLPGRVIDGPWAHPCSAPTPRPYCLNRLVSVKDGGKKKKTELVSLGREAEQLRLIWIASVLTDKAADVSVMINAANSSGQTICMWVLLEKRLF